MLRNTVGAAYTPRGAAQQGQRKLCPRLMLSALSWNECALVRTSSQEAEAVVRTAR